MTSSASGEKDMKMIKIETNVPELDKDNASLMLASEILEQLSNKPGITLPEFQRMMIQLGIPLEEQEDVVMAAISIETMMSLDRSADLYDEPTIH